MSATAEEIKTLWAQVDELEQKAVELEQEISDKRWQLAEWLFEGSKGGKTQTRLADEIGKKQSAVSRYIKVWREHRGIPAEDRPLFKKAWAKQYPKGSKSPKLPGDDSSDDYQGNNEAPGITELLALDPETAAGIPTDEDWKQYRQIADDLGNWTVDFIDKLEARFLDDSS